MTCSRLLDKSMTDDFSETEYTSCFDGTSIIFTRNNKDSKEDIHVIKVAECVMLWQDDELNRFYADLLNRQPYPDKAHTDCTYVVCRHGRLFERSKSMGGVWMNREYLSSISSGPKHYVVIWKQPSSNMVILDASNSQFRSNYPSTLLVSEDVLNRL